MSMKRNEIVKAVETLIQASKTETGKQIIEELNVKFELLKVMTEEGEEWRDVEGYDGDYQVSNFGKVRSHKSGKWKLMKLPLSHGYSTVSLSKNSKGTKCLVHILVAKAFIPNPDNLPIVEHKDNIKINCNVDNLFWSTQQKNVEHAVRDGLNESLKGAKHPLSKLNDDEVRWIRKNYIKYDKQYGTNAIAKKFNVSQKLIYEIISNKRWNHIE